MSAYFVKGKGWRYDFTLMKVRYTETWFKTKNQAKTAESAKRLELKKPPSAQNNLNVSNFFELVEARLKHVKAYNSKSHFNDTYYMACRWLNLWGNLSCENITTSKLEQFVLERRKVSSHTANKEIRYLRATFNYGKRKKMISHNPADDLEFLPVEKRIKYIPSHDNVEAVIQQADPATQDYLNTLSDTMARVSEINRLKWNDVNFETKTLALYTRKKKGGHLTPRIIPMTERLYQILNRRFRERDSEKEWVFWHRYFDRKEKVWKEGPYQDRKRIMKTLCKKAGVKYFRFHALRHEGASSMDNSGEVSIGAIQRILGHENRSTTEIYLHSLGDTEREAIHTLERVRAFSHTEPHTGKKRG